MQDKKTIQVDRETWKWLQIKKMEIKKKTVNEVIHFLIKECPDPDNEE
jgi:hypothetical protein